MMYVPYNSRKLYHKSKFGAVKTDEEFTVRFVMPRDFRVSGARLALREDNDKEYTKYPFYWDCMQGENEEWWKIDISIPESGLYWYHFEYDCPFGISRILCVGNGMASLNTAGTDFQLTVYDKSFKTPDSLKGGIYYQIFPDRFNASDKKKNNIPADRIINENKDSLPFWKADKDNIIKNNDFFGGDLNGITNKLGYLKSLGVTCIYLNPIFEAQSNHRYDTANYKKIDPLLGDENDFKNLCKKADEAGIKIILDGVFSHTGADSVYFNMFSRYNSTGAYNSKQSPYYEWYKFKCWPDDYLSWWNIKILPEVVEENKSFIEYITGENGVLKKWMRLGASGWRLDVADELPDIFIDSVRACVKEENEQAVIIGEVWEDATNKLSYNKRRRYLLGKQLDTVMNYPFANGIINFVKDGNAEDFSEKITTILENYPKESIDILMNHIGTHDTLRALNALSGISCKFRSREWQAGNKLPEEEYLFASRLLIQAAVIQFTLPGIPCVYYGDEAGMQGWEDPFNRCFYPWKNQNESILKTYKLLGKIRRENEVFKKGSFKFISALQGCAAYKRFNSEEEIMVIANSNIHPITYYLPHEWESSELIFGGIGKHLTAVEIDEHSAVIIKKQKKD